MSDDIFKVLHQLSREMEPDYINALVADERLVWDKSGMIASFTTSKTRGEQSMANTDNMTPLDYRLHMEGRAHRAAQLESIQVNSRPMDEGELTHTLQQLGMTQTELAQTIGVDPSTVWRWVNGATVIPRPTAALLRLLVDLK